MKFGRGAKPGPSPRNPNYGSSRTEPYEPPVPLPGSDKIRTAKKGGTMKSKMADKAGRAMKKRTADTMGRAMVKNKKMAGGGMAYSDGGSVYRKAADGVATKGKTKGKIVRMMMGGVCK
jgi:hypothetical protein